MKAKNILANELALPDGVPMPKLLDFTFGMTYVIMMEARKRMKKIGRKGSRDFYDLMQFVVNENTFPDFDQFIHDFMQSALESDDCTAGSIVALYDKKGSDAYD